MPIPTASRRELAANSVEKPDRFCTDRPAPETIGIEPHSLRRASSADARHALIAEVAYRRAELPGFSPANICRTGLQLSVKWTRSSTRTCSGIRVRIRDRIQCNWLCITEH
jgi:hypothetical protein